MFVFNCEAVYQPDNGQNDVTDGSVENYDFDWGQPLDTEPLDDALTDDERTQAQHTEEVFWRQGSTPADIRQE